MRYVAPVPSDRRSPSASAAGRGRPVRAAVDSMLCLAVAVILFRTFLVEGYMISTGSMAPALLGFHKQVVCPSCGFAFAHGVRWDESVSDADADAAAGSAPARAGRREVAGEAAAHGSLCRCPNCGQEGIDVIRVPRNQGDQLLVHKYAHVLRPPARWEVAVFRNPYRPTQPYVKRVAGLPGETITIRAGDVYADGAIRRKDVAAQRAVRIPVFDVGFRPQDDPAWQPRWQTDPAWRLEGTMFRLEPDTSPAGGASAQSESEWAWVRYRHWLREGGTHRTAAHVPVSDTALTMGDRFAPVRFDPKTRQIVCVGVMPDEVCERLLSLSDDLDFREAVLDLHERSHAAPVTDYSAYNPSAYRNRLVPVRDVMFAGTVSLGMPLPGRIGQFAVELTDGRGTWRFVLDALVREAQLWELPGADGGRPRLLRKTYLPAGRLIRPVLIEMSLMDRQVLVALDGELPFEPWPLDEPVPTDEPPRQPVRFAARGLAARVERPRLYRDVYYTSRSADKPCRLGAGEYFMLGDNSQVSLDSRRWPDGAVPERLLLGRPLIVHLPSTQLKLRIGEGIRYIRVPDFPRIRYIH
jgi:signal peptidase I